MADDDVSSNKRRRLEDDKMQFSFKKELAEFTGLEPTLPTHGLPGDIKMTGKGATTPSVRKFNVSGNNNIRQDHVFDSMEAFVNEYVANPLKRRPITKMLVATNGIAAVRCILSIRRLLMQLFRNDKMIKFICLTTQHEVESNAEYLKMADFIVFSPTGSNKNNYANVTEIINHAVENDVDAVWAGWGHASENPELPRQLAEKNIVFIGPPSGAMFSLGDKIASTIIAQTVGIPTIAWSGAGIMMANEKRSAGDIVEVPKHLIEKATVTNAEEGIKALKLHDIGFPLMIKASEGGGGKGIRKCTCIEDFKDLFEQVSQEVPGSPIFLMKCVVNARHIEVQLIADRYETVIPVFTRDCSIQRRCQKIIEEAPASVAEESILRAMQQDAVNIAKFVGYESAGTVEYMYLPDEQTYFFLELNPRLQVEHPCTEMIANISIPAIQVQIAMGVPLHRILDIRMFFGLDRYGDCPLPDDTILTKTDHCVIAARITSEDPEDSFRPSIGAVEALNFRSSQDVWGYFSVSSGGKVHEFADSQFGHLFARGRTRPEAITNLLGALKELELRATFHSQVSYLVDLLLEPDFADNKFNTQWLDIRIAQKIKQKLTIPMSEIVAVSAAVIGHTRVTDVFNNFRSAIDRGQVLPPHDLTETFLFDLVKDLKIYSMTVTRCAPLSYVVMMNGSTTKVDMIVLGNGRLMVTRGENAYQCSLEETQELFKVTIGKTIVVFEKDNDPSVLKSPYTGKLLTYKKETGDDLKVGDIYAIVESMKLVFNVEVKKAPGRFLQVANEGDPLYPGSVIARLTDQQDVEKYKPKPFTDQFNEWNSTMKIQDLSPAKLFHQLLGKCTNILNGSAPLGGDSAIQELFKELFDKFLSNKDLAKIVYSPAITSLLEKLDENAQKQLFVELHGQEFNIQKVITILKNSRAATEEAGALANRIAEECKNGFAVHVIDSLFKQYIEVEKYFEGKIYDDSVSDIKKAISDSSKIVDIIYSHTQRHCKNVLMFYIMETLSTHGAHFISDLTESLRECGNLHNSQGVSLKARELLMTNLVMKYHENFEELTSSVSPVLPDVDDIIKWLDNPAPFSPLWKCIHEYFFDEAHGDAITDAYITNFLAAVKDTHSVHQYSNCKIRLSKYTLVRSSTDPHKVELTQKTLFVARVTVSREDHPNVLTTQLHDVLQQFIGNNSQDVLVTGYVKITGTESENLGSAVPHISEDESAMIGEADDAMDMLVASLKTTVYLNICLAKRPLPQVDFLDAMRLKLYRLPADAISVSSPISSVYTYQVDDEDQKFARLFTGQTVTLRKRGSQRMFDDLSTKTIFGAIDAAVTAAKVVMASSKKSFTENHGTVFLILPNCDEMNRQEVSLIIQDELNKYTDLLSKHSFSKFEIVFTYNTDVGVHTSIVEYEDFGGVLTIVSESDGLVARHEQLTKRQKKQFFTRASSAIYCYDVPMLFARCVYNRWMDVEKETFDQSINKVPESIKNALLTDDWRGVVETTEYDMRNGQLVELSHAEMTERLNSAGNRCGIVGFKIKIYTPNDINGCEFIVIANDITFQAGSFGIIEDDFFAALSREAQLHNVPLVNISCNSGARIGIANKVLPYLKVQLKSGPEPRGFDYLYVEEENLKTIGDQIRTKKLEDGRHQVVAVIGSDKEHIGVENLMGSGLIAGVTAQAYHKIPTYCLVTGRSVGIGAYTARLAHRIVQHKSSNLILTGAAALNTLLGKKVYSSNNQLGGVDIMHRNGVAHAVAEDNLRGIDKILDWITYLPQEVDTFPYFSRSVSKDNEPRKVTLPVGAGERDYDVRQLIDSKELGVNTGICDSGSFDEICSEWAKSIVVGRARLCGVPVGVIATELRNFNTLTPADPAVEGSEAQNTIRAGQVWYPDSAYKTAEAINDFNVERLPLLFLASLRGFSGGQKDMYDMVLKFGAEIVDALKAYNRPVIVYIPANGELRGGAWAVLDKNINPQFITMVADETSRGGILEPNAIVGIKLREPAMRGLMAASDDEYKNLQARLNGEDDAKEKRQLSEKLSNRELELKNAYRNAAVEFADAHDRWPRMVAVKAVQHTTTLENSRITFFDILRVELAKTHLAEEYLNIPQVSRPTMSDAMIVVNKELDAWKLEKKQTKTSDYDALSTFCQKRWRKTMAVHVAGNYKKLVDSFKTLKSKYN